MTVTNIVYCLKVIIIIIFQQRKCWKLRGIKLGQAISPHYGEAGLIP